MSLEPGKAVGQVPPGEEAPGLLDARTRTAGAATPADALLGPNAEPLVAVHSGPASQEMEALLAEVETEWRFRKLVGPLARLVTVLAILLALFHLYTAGFGLLDNFRQRAVHITGVLLLVFLLYPASRRSPKTRPGWLDWLMVALTLAGGGWIITSYQEYAYSGGRIPLTPIGLPGLGTWNAPLPLITGGMMLIVVFEGARRTIGLSLPLISALFVLYGLWGNLVPGYFAARGFGPERVVEHLYLSDNGVFGIPLGVSATYVILFILFGAFLQRVGLLEFFTDLALSIAGHTTGGPAKVAIMASALFGMINGSAIANVVTLGSFTIPLMKRTGYKPHFAGAVESTASMGGQIMPPVMGAAAFIMAENLQVPYAIIALSAIIPAVLYFLASGVMVHFEAAKEHVARIPRSQLPSPWSVIRQRGYLVLPAAVMVYLLMTGYSALFAGFWGCVSALGMALVQELVRAQRTASAGAVPAGRAYAGALRSWVLYALEGMESGVRNTLTVATATAVVGFIIGVVTLTGLGPKLAAGIVDLGATLGQGFSTLTFGLVPPGGANTLFWTLLLTMVASILLGTGLPTTPTYIITAAMCVPALLQLGVPRLAAHMFVFYYGILSDLTPPTAIAPYAASAIAGTDHTRTEWTAMKLALAGFLVPFSFAFDPSMLIIGYPPVEIAKSAITGILGVVALGAALEGYLVRNATWPERAVLLAGALLLILPGLESGLVGFGMAAAVFLWQKLGPRPTPAAGAVRAT